MTAASLLLALALIAANGFFVGAEFAVLAARRSRLEPLLRTSRRARTALRGIEQLPLMISACQFGITLASLGLGALAEPAVASVLAGPWQPPISRTGSSTRSRSGSRSPWCHACTCCSAKWCQRTSPSLGQNAPR